MLMLRNITRGTTIAERLDIADTFFKRLRGLMGRRELPEGEGLLLTACNAIHTFGMRFPIDVLFLDENHGVVHAIHALGPRRIGGPVRTARYAVELPAGTIARSRTEVGDRVAKVPVDACAQPALPKD